MILRRMVQEVNSVNGLPMWQHQSNGDLRAAIDDGWMDVNGWEPVMRWDAAPSPAAPADAMTEYTLSCDWVRWDAVDEQCWWWHWNEDPDSCQVPVSIMSTSDAEGKHDFFANAGQLGWTEPQMVKDIGGWWMKMIQPSLPEETYIPDGHYVVETLDGERLVKKQCPICDRPLLDSAGRPTACAKGYCPALSVAPTEADALMDYSSCKAGELKPRAKGPKQ